MLICFTKLLIGALIGYLLATTFESLLHRSVGHASADARRRWDKLGWLGAGLRRAYFGHAILHHGKTFQENHVTQFRSLAEREALDVELIESQNEIFVHLRYGLVTNLVGSLFYVAIPGILCIVSSFIAFGKAECLYLLSAGLPILSTPMLSNMVHPYLHLSISDAHRHAPFCVRWLLVSPYGRWARKNHYVHHRCHRVNFNLLPGGDYLFGTYRRASEDEIADMKSIGLLASESREIAR